MILNNVFFLFWQRQLRWQTRILFSSIRYQLKLPLRKAQTQMSSTEFGECQTWKPLSKILTTNTTASDLLAISQPEEGTFARHFIQKYKARMIVERNLSNQPDNTFQNQKSDTADKSRWTAQPTSAVERPGPPPGICKWNYMQVTTLPPYLLSLFSGND